jgi:tRNA pseudouridine38-40 synthase
LERRTYALRLAYDGAAFRGWQRQPGLPTVQQAVEDALAVLLGERVRVVGAARTDAGVHAEGQVASFAVRRALSPGALRDLRVPDGIRVLGAAPARPAFHARSSAAGKRYRYRFAAGSPLAWDLGPATPDWGRARAALAGLGGLPHLAGLASPARGRSPAPPLDEWSLVSGAETAELTVRARAFRKHQIRNLAGHLAAVALGLATPESLGQLARGLRPWGGATAPAQGLTLVEVLYPPELDPFR